MSKISEYNRIQQRGRGYDVVSWTTTFLGFVPYIRKNQQISNLLTATSTVCSIASFINFMRKVGYYGTIDEISDSEIFLDMINNLVLNPIVCSIGIAMNISDNNKKW